MPNKSDQDLITALTALKRTGTIDRSLWPATAPSPESLGLTVVGNRLHWATEPDRLDGIAVQQGLPGVDVEVFDVIDSTNTQLLMQAQNPATRLYLAEFQSGGRGRRGRAWLSPYARNLSMSLGQRTQKQLNQLGGLSLVVGLALVDVLRAMSITGVGLKWPNDVLVDDSKIAGVLVELAALDQGAYLVIGMGVNVDLMDAEEAQIGQRATDLRRCGVQLRRTELVIAFMQQLLGYLEQFERRGFEQFIERFNQHHVFHDRDCRIIQGETTYEGKVLGIGLEGELILSSAGGERRFHGGEVSMRAMTT